MPRGVFSDTPKLCNKGIYMSIWGKLTGAAAGFAVGGPIGALAGGIAGHLAADQEQDGGEDQKQVAFTVAVIALGAKMAKADGVVTKTEVHAFKEVFKIPDGEMNNVARIFDLAKQDVAGYEAYAKQLGILYKEDPRLLRDVLEGLFHIAVSDALLHPREEEYLRQVSVQFGFAEEDFRHIRSRFVTGDTRNPYDVLKVNPAISDEELKSKYHRLVADNHPDKLVARGVPQEFVIIATNKLAAINAAYEEIRSARRMRH
jgi:DnaJ like chaperone protein